MPSLICIIIIYLRYYNKVINESINIISFNNLVDTIMQHYIHTNYNVYIIIFSEYYLLQIYIFSA